MRPATRLAALSAAACLATFAAPSAASAATNETAGAAAVAKPAVPVPSASSCAVSAPPVVTTTGTKTSVEMRLGQCPLGSRATWRLVSPSDKDVARVSLTGREQTVTIPTPDASAIGRYRLVPVSGSDAENGLMYLTPGAIVVKSGSRLSTNVGRTNVAVAATRFDLKAKKLRPWSGAVASLQKGTCRGSVCTWETVKSARTDAKGSPSRRRARPTA
ncbi:hypothetical protein [Mobilicoccus massiliensis]|uniref:hypothetical protein n=1 Tax=Mobilicoccus massiliensis TaxID=1522310 RepID=UPI001142A56A|nr:hypothetical protein [Mobilicoccus massiliensis]